MMDSIVYHEFRDHDREVLTHNEATLMDALEAFAEIEDADPRLLIILAAARIETAIEQAIDVYAPKGRRMPHKFHSRVNYARQMWIVADDFVPYVRAIRKLRNIVAHRPTRRASVVDPECQSLIEQAFRYAEPVPIWPQPVPPSDDLRRCIFATCLAGVIAAEMDFFDPLGNLIPKGFETVCEWAGESPPSG
ncbi:hypothetical protein U8335_02240 [Roseiconus lacunae]|uniref:hypothetical protein n=1 Tax=Roseiconus lacunae TaxID=2605694 RepID=UPI003091428A|nr:hypothetical protein U8335_02240 [Stieleria sp. HD01]